MKFVIVLLSLVTFTYKAQAARPFPSSQFELVQKNLDKELFNFRTLINFTFKGDKASLLIYNDICPQRPGMISCKAMPIPVVNSQYKMTLVNIDHCGVKIYESNVVENQSFMTSNAVDQSMLVIRDNSFSVCEIAYASQIEVTLKINRMNIESGKTVSYESYLGFNELMQILEPSQGLTIRD